MCGLHVLLSTVCGLKISLTTATLLLDVAAPETYALFKEEGFRLAPYAQVTLAAGPWGGCHALGVRGEARTLGGAGRA